MPCWCLKLPEKVFKDNKKMIGILFLNLIIHVSLPWPVFSFTICSELIVLYTNNLWTQIGYVATRWAMTMKKRYSFDSLWCLDMFQAKEHLFKHICHRKKLPQTFAHVDIHVSDHILWPSTGHVARIREIKKDKS